MEMANGLKDDDRLLVDDERKAAMVCRIGGEQKSEADLLKEGWEVGGFLGKASRLFLLRGRGSENNKDAGAANNQRKKEMI